MQKQKKSSIGSMLLTAIVILAILLYVIFSLNLKDPLWFIPTYNATASEIIIHCYGEDVQVEPGSAAFVSLNDAVNKGISGTKRWDSLSLSTVTYEDYMSNPKMMVLDFRYDKPQMIHSAYRFFKKFDQLLIPLVGRHANYNSVFGRLGEYPEAGSFHLRDNAPILQLVEELQLCKNQNSQ